MQDPYSYMILMLCAGAAFSTVENVIYVFVYATTLGPVPIATLTYTEVSSSLRNSSRKSSCKSLCNSLLLTPQSQLFCRWPLSWGCAWSASSWTCPATASSPCSPQSRSSRYTQTSIFHITYS